MGEYHAGQALEEAIERHEGASRGDRLIPISAAVLAVFAALATLFSSHASNSTITQKNEAILWQSKAADSYNYYEAKRIKLEVNQALVRAGLVNSAGARAELSAIVRKEDVGSARVLKLAREQEALSEQHSALSERSMHAYEWHEIAATLFEVSVVLVSITALTRTRVLLAAAGVASAVGLFFFVAGFL